MLTKMLTAMMMTGALWVAGDAAYQKLDCCFLGLDCCQPQRECCFRATSTKESNCCLSGSDRGKPAPACCAALKSDCCATKSSCCEATYVYCTRTEEVYEGCCCEIVNGQHRCLVTGIVSDECCCIPLD